MLKVFWLCFELFINLFQGVVCSSFIWKTAESKISKTKSLICFWLCSFSYFAVVTLMNYISYFEGIGIFAYTGVFFFFLLFCHYGNIFKKILLAVIPTSCLAFSNVIVVQFSGVVFDIPIVDILSKQDLARFTIVIIVNIILVIILLLIQTLFTKNDISLNKSEWLLICSVLSLSVLDFAFLYGAIFLGASQIIRQFIAIAIFLLIVIVSTVYFLLIKLSNKNRIETEHILLKQQYNLQAKSIEEIKNQYTKLRKTRHDFSNILKIVHNLLNDNKIPEANEYISQYFQKQKETARFIVTDNEYVNAIINLKLSDATAKNIEIKINTISDIGNVDNWDLCNLLGNMLDNAIESCEKCTERYISLYIARENNFLIIAIKNKIEKSILKDNPALNTNKNGLEHGYGIRIIKDIAQHHNGFVDFYEEDNYFCCRVYAEFNCNI
ncbi:MAG: GHKL domain-containing protein [Clostridia bacterium]|nr:GHKL domain-containing protein [Clostridia bacterium]